MWERVRVRGLGVKRYFPPSSSLSHKGRGIFRSIFGDVNQSFPNINGGIMKILAAIQGEYGKRIAENISQRMPDDWELETITLPRALPVLIDEPDHPTIFTA